VIGLFDRCREHHRNRVANDPVYGAVVGEDDFGHALEIGVQRGDDDFRISLLDQRREIGQVSQYERANPPFATQPQSFRVVDQIANQVRRHVA